MSRRWNFRTRRPVALLLPVIVVSLVWTEGDLARSQTGPRRLLLPATPGGMRQRAPLPAETLERVRAQFVLEARTAASRQRELDAFASGIAHHAIAVGCALDNADWQWHRFFVGEASGYAATSGRGAILWLGPNACRGALAVARGDEQHPARRRALGVLVLTHEALHLRRHWPAALDEAEVECAAIRRFMLSVGELGGTRAQAEELYPWALAIHWWLARQSGEYWKPSCRLPSLT